MPAWIPVVVIVGAIAVYVLVRVFGGKSNDRRELVDRAKADAENIKAAADAQLAAELQEVDADKAALAEIEKIDDDAARLNALADYANRRRKR